MMFDLSLIVTFDRNGIKMRMLVTVEALHQASVLR